MKKAIVIFNQFEFPWNIYAAASVKRNKDRKGGKDHEKENSKPFNRIIVPGPYS